MYRSIMLPVDGTETDAQAIPIATSLARRCGAQLRVVHVHEPAPIGEWELMTPFRFEGVETSERDWDGAELLHEKEHFARFAEAAECKVIQGPVVPALEREIAESDPDLIVMATHARTGLARALVGSVADHLIRDVRKPVLLVRVPATPAHATELRTDRILVPLDGTAMASSVLKHALSIADPDETRITLFRVVPPPYVAMEIAAVSNGDSSLAERVESAHAYLNGIATELGAEGYLVDTDVAVSHAPADAILRQAREKQCDVICMATHARAGLRRAVLGSVASKVLHNTPVPVMLYRP
jgi:nucleotide-binding universal stress UspA family protein